MDGRLEILMTHICVIADPRVGLQMRVALLERMLSVLRETPAAIDSEFERTLLDDWKMVADDPALGPLDFEEFRAGYVGFECWYRAGFSVLVRALVS
jgi:hypothetical protein